MQMTHEEARRLIHFKEDNGLNSINEAKLSAHLKDCGECRRYFDKIKETGAIVRQTMRKQWNVHPLPLQMEVIYAKVNSNPGTNIFVTTRSALIGIAFVMFAFITWQSITTSRLSPSPLGAVPLIPTPATQFTATNTLQNECKEIRYVTHPGDTLDSIAEHFSVSKETIIAANNITSGTISQTAELIIPFCESTPTSTFLPPTFTITPNLEPISTTPG